MTDAEKQLPMSLLAINLEVASGQTVELPLLGLSLLIVWDVATRSNSDIQCRNRRNKISDVTQLYFDSNLSYAGEAPKQAVWFLFCQ